MTHDNYSTLSSFSLFLSFVTNSPVAEKKLSGSIDLGLIVVKALNSFFKVIWPVLCSRKKHISFFKICDRISSCAGIALWSSLLRITWILCFESKWLIKLSVLEPPAFVSRSWALFYKEWLELLIFVDFWRLSPECAWLKIYLQSLLKERQTFCRKLLQTEKERIDFANNPSLYMN